MKIAVGRLYGLNLRRDTRRHAAAIVGPQKHGVLLSMCGIERGIAMCLVIGVLGAARLSFGFCSLLEPCKWSRWSSE